MFLYSGKVRWLASVVISCNPFEYYTYLQLPRRINFFGRVFLNLPDLQSYHTCPSVPSNFQRDHPTFPHQPTFSQLIVPDTLSASRPRFPVSRWWGAIVMFVTARLMYVIDLSGSLSSQTVEGLLLERGFGAWNHHWIWWLRSGMLIFAHFLGEVEDEPHSLPFHVAVTSSFYSPTSTTPSIKRTYLLYSLPGKL